jgi:hypothetical protein
VDENEIRANGLKARIEELARAAEERHKAEPSKPEPLHVSVTADSPIATTTPATPWWNNTWVVTVGGGVIAALIVALVVWVISSH